MYVTSRSLRQNKHTLTSTWLKTLFNFLGDNDVLLHDRSLKLKKREGNNFLMQYFLLGTSTTTEL